MNDVAFVSREGAKIVRLVEAAVRPAPIISFIARRATCANHISGG
jgi:hypothetical protein